jgi:hypothetical protein
MMIRMKEYVLYSPQRLQPPGFDQSAVCRNDERQKRINDISVIQDLLLGAEAEFNRRKSTIAIQFFRPCDPRRLI